MYFVTIMWCLGGSAGNVLITISVQSATMGTNTILDTGEQKATGNPDHVINSSAVNFGNLQSSEQQDQNVTKLLFIWNILYFIV